MTKAFTLGEVGVRENISPRKAYLLAVTMVTCRLTTTLDCGARPQLLELTFLSAHLRVTGYLPHLACGLVPEAACNILVRIDLLHLV